MATLRNLIPGYDPNDPTLSRLVPGTPGTVAPSLRLNHGASMAAADDAQNAAGMSQLRRSFASALLGAEANRMSSDESGLRADGLTDEADELRMRSGMTRQRADVFAPREQDVTTLRWDEPGRAVDWGLGAVGSVAGSIRDPLAVAAASNVTGGVVGMIPHPIAKLAGKGIQYGGTLLAGSMNFDQNKGEFYNRVSNDPAAMAGQSAQDINTTANVVGGAAGALDTVLPWALARRTTQFGVRPTAAGRATLRDTATETFTETAQTGIQQAGHTSLNADRDTSGDMNELINAAATGGFGTAPIAGALNYAAKGRGRRNVTDDPNDDLSDLSGTAKKPPGKESLTDELVRGSKSNAEVEAAFEWNNVLEGLTDPPDGSDPDQFRQDALIKELTGRVEKGETAAQQHLDTLTALTPDDPLWVDHPARAEAHKYLVGDGTDLNKLVEKFRTRRKSQQGHFEPSTPGELATQVLKTAIPAGRLPEDVNPDEVAKDLGYRLAGLAGLKGAKNLSVGTRLRLQDLANDFVSLYGTTQGAQAAVARVASALGTETTPAFKALQQQLASPSARAFKQSARAERMEAAQGLAALVPPEVKLKLFGLGLDLTTPAGQMSLLDRTQDLAYASGARTRSEFASLFGPAVTDKMMTFVEPGKIEEREGAGQRKTNGGEKTSREDTTPPESDDTGDGGLSRDNEKDSWELEGALKNIERAPGSKLYVAKHQRGVRSSTEGAHPFIPDKKSGKLPHLSLENDTDESTGFKTLEAMKERVFTALGGVLPLPPKSKPDDTETFWTSVKKVVDGGVRRSTKELTQGQFVKNDDPNAPPVLSVGSYRVREVSAKEVMDDRGVNAARRLSLMRQYLQQDGVIGEGDRTLNQLASLDRRIREAEQTTPKQTSVLQGMKLDDDRVKIGARLVDNPEYAQLQDLKAQRADVMSKFADKIGVKVKDDATLKDLTDAYFGERFIVTAEQMAERDQLRLDLAEVLRMFRRGNNALDASTNPKTNFGLTPEEVQADMNLIRFKSKHAITKSDGRKGIAVVPAGDLVAWVYEGRNDFKPADAGKEAAKQYRDALMEGIGALAEGGYLDELPYMLNENGQRENFGDPKTGGFPPSLKLGAVRHGELLRRSRESAQVFAQRVAEERRLLASMTPEQRAERDAFVEGRRQTRVALDQTRAEKDRNTDPDELLPEGREQNPKGEPRRPPAQRTLPGLKIDPKLTPTWPPRPGTAPPARYWDAPSTPATDPAIPTNPEFDNPPGTPDRRFLDGTQIQGDLPGIPEAPGPVASSVRPSAVGVTRPGQKVDEKRSGRFPTAPETVDTRRSDDGRTQLDWDLQEQKPGRVPTDFTAAQMSKAVADAALTEGEARPLTPTNVMARAPALAREVLWQLDSFDGLVDGKRVKSAVPADPQGAFQRIRRLVAAFPRPVSPSGNQPAGGRHYALPVALILTPANVEVLVSKAQNKTTARPRLERLRDQTAAALLAAQDGDMPRAAKVMAARALLGEAEASWVAMLPRLKAMGDRFAADQHEKEVRGERQSGPASKTPVFDKLPAHKPGQRTLRYAGIGSRETPPEMLAVMKKAAAKLAGMGYTLLSGGAKGADSAFEAGAGGSKEIFLAGGATEQTRAIAREIHPAPGALSGYILDLMARNTSQVFGADLNSPVDFVLAWTKDGATSTAERSRSTGGTGQAIDMASRKGIPVINMAREGWQAQLRALVGEPPKAAPTPTNDSVRDMPMNYRDGTDGMRMRPALAGKSTMDLIREGVRTATTGSLGRFAGLKVGDVFTVVGADGERIRVRVTAMPVKVSTLSASEWAKPEGWMSTNHAKYKDAWQMRYELADKPADTGVRKNSMTGPAAEVGQQVADTRSIMAMMGFKAAVPKFSDVAAKLLTDPDQDVVAFTKQSAEALSHIIMKGPGGAEIRAALQGDTWFAERARITARLMKTGMMRGDALVESYRVITEQALLGELVARTAAEKSVLAKLMQAVKDFVAAFRAMTGSSEFADLVREHLNRTITNSMTPSQLKDGYAKVSFQQAVDRDPQSARVLAHMSKNKNVAITGSIVLAEAGTIYRDAANMLHDLDFLVSSTKAEAEAHLRSAFPDAVQVYDFNTSNGKVDSYLVPPAGAKITNIVREFGEKGRVLGFTVERDGQVIGRTWNDAKGEHKSGDAGTFVDLFTNSKTIVASTIPFTVGGRQYSIRAANPGTIFDAKLNMGRPKDMNDYGLFVPRVGKPLAADARLNSQTGAGTFSDAAIAEAKAWLTKTLGDVKVEFSKTLGHAGEWVDAERTVRLSTAIGPGVLSVAYHEGMHKFWSDFAKNNEGVAKVLSNTFSHPAMLQRLKDLLADHPDALKAIEEGSPNFLEERVAYGFQFWAAGLLTVDRPATTLFDKFRQFLRKVLGMVRESETALALMTALHEGKLAEPSAAGQVIDKIMKDHTWNDDFKTKFDKAVQNSYAMIATANDMLRKEDFSPTARKLGMLMFTNPGEELSGRFKEGYLNARTRVLRQYTNFLYGGVRGEDGVARGGIKDLSEPDMLEALTALQLKTPLGEIRITAVREAVKGVRALLDRYYDYAKKAGVKLDYLEPNYFPRVWSVNALVEDGGREKFAAMLQSRPQYLKIIDEIVAGLNAASTKKYTRDDVVNQMVQHLIDRNGVDEKGLDAESTNDILTPFFASQKERSFKWLLPEDVEPFLEKDLVGAMSRYLHQGVRTAEFVRRFGEGGALLKDLTAMKGDEWINPETDRREARPEHGAIAAEIEASLKKKGIEGKEAELILARHMEDVVNSIKAHEGSLGKEISDIGRKTASTLMAYQNLRLLPLSLFSAFADTVGIAARFGKGGGGLALEAFVQGLKDVYARWKREASDMPGERNKSVWEGIAEMAGAVDSHMFLEQLGKAHASEFMTDSARRVNRWLFMVNGLTAWDRSMRVSATKAAVLFLQNHASLPDVQHSARWLAELGLKATDIPLDSNGRLITDRRVLAAEKGVSVDDATAQMETVHRAIVRWVEGAIMTPNAGQRPIWASDPHYAVFFHLKQFTYSFHHTVLKRAFNEISHGNMSPVGALVAAVPTMIVADITRALVSGGGSLPGYMTSWTLADHLMNGVQRAGLLGVGQFGVDAMKDPINLLGPTVDQAADWVFKADEIGKNTLNAVPGLRLSGDLKDMVRVAG